MNKIQIKRIKAGANLAYDQFESEKYTVGQAARTAERWLASAETDDAQYEAKAFRNDISTHMGKITDTFDRNKHTHHFANLFDGFFFNIIDNL